MPSQKLKSKQALHKHLSDKSREDAGSNTILIPAKYARYSVEDTFRQFKLADMDAYGDYACAYGEYGVGVSVNVGLDFASLLSGGFPTLGFLSLTVSVEAKMERLQETMLVLHQVAPKRNKTRRIYIDRTLLWKGNKWRTRKPVALMPFSGVKKEYQGSIAFDFTTQIMPMAGIDGYDLAPDIKGGSANLTLSIVKQKFAWATDLPRWYPDYVDPDITTDFGNFLGAPSKTRVKEEIIEWLRHLKSIVKQVNRPFMNELKKELKDLPKRRFHREAHVLPRWRNTSTENVGKKLDKIMTEVERVMGMNWEGDTILITSDRKEILVQLEWFQKTLKNARDEEVFDTAARALKRSDGIPAVYFRNPTEWMGLDIAVKDKYAKLCFVRLEVWNPEISANVGIALKPEIIGKNKNGEGIAGSEALTVNPGALDAGYAVKYATSRYQSFALSQHSSRPQVLTQDTYVRYGQWWFSAKVAATMDNLRTLYVDTLEKEGIVRINKLKYSAVSCYWLYRESAGRSTVTLRPGTGISFGTHINPAKLESLVRRLEIDSEKEDAWLKATIFATRLHMDRDAFEEFAAEFKAKTITDIDNWERIKNNFSAILLESAFRFSGNSATLNDGKLSDMLSTFEELMKHGANLGNPAHAHGPFTLESVRIRVRMADHRTGPGTAYKLGWVHGPVTIALKFQKITQSGNEGVSEYLYHAAESNPPATVIPPVFLIPHTFQ